MPLMSTGSHFDPAANGDGLSQVEVADLPIMSMSSLWAGLQPCTLQTSRRQHT